MQAGLELMSCWLAWIHSHLLGSSVLIVHFLLFWAFFFSCQPLWQYCLLTVNVAVLFKTFFPHAQRWRKIIETWVSTSYSGGKLLTWKWEGFQWSPCSNGLTLRLREARVISCHVSLALGYLTHQGKFLFELHVYSLVCHWFSILFCFLYD